MAEPIKCINCPNMCGPGGAKGLCSRCYVYKKRNGKLPPSEPFKGYGFFKSLHLRINDDQERRYTKAAKRARADLSTWARNVLDANA